MATGKQKSNAVMCECSKCKLKSIAVPDKKHRNCGGKENANIRPYHHRVTKGARGVWQPA